MAGSRDPYAHFRLNLEQQRKRAKELLKSAKAGDARALARLACSGATSADGAPPKLAAAQLTIARELRFASWAELKQHAAAMQRERRAVDAAARATTGATTGAMAGAAADATPDALDADLRTLHVRCGSDIRSTLAEAGFAGDFYEHSYPYLIGPVSDGPGCLEQRARFICDSYDSAERPLDYDRVLASLRDAEQRLADSAGYARVVIWSEHDAYDQLVLIRLLGHYAVHRRPPVLETIDLGDFPGGARFVGLGQLPPEALRMLWPTRAAVGDAQLRLGLAAWTALASDDPRALAAIARSGTPALPLLAPALARHLRELPSAVHGLSFTEQKALEMLADAPRSIESMFAEMTSRVDPLPGQGDLQFRDRVLALERVREPLLTRAPGADRHGRSRPPWTDVLTITETGRSVLGGEIDYLSLDPPPRWVGGVEIGPGRPDWRWSEPDGDAVPRGGG